MEPAEPAADAPPRPWHAEFAAALRTQLQNQFVGGSVALFAASALLRSLWRSVAALRAAAQDALFTRYDFPLGSPQAIAAARFLQSQPAMARASHRVVMDRRSLRNSALATARAHAQVPGYPGELRALVDDAGGGSRFVSVPTLAAGRSALLLWRRRLIWARAGAEARDRSISNYVGDQAWSPFSAMDSFDASCDVAGAAANAAAGGATPAGSITVFVMRLPLGSDRRGEQAVAALLEEGEQLALRGTGGARFTQINFSHSTDRGVGALQFHWAPAGLKPARSIDSVILPGDAAVELLADARAFLDAEAWYADRGVPYRRGYLLHGTPGSGKSSLITAIAGELQLPVYCLSLSAPGFDDAALQMLLAQNIAARAIVVLEDVDAAFTPLRAASCSRAPGVGAGGSRLSYSGLLNALDGLVASEGRLLFLTANDESRLPPALVRPGRVDRRLRFGPATPEQAERLFRRFYSDEDAEDAEAMAPRFAAALPAGRFCMAALQGHLLRFRGSPGQALHALPELLRGEDTVADAAADAPRAEPATPAPKPHGSPMTLRRRAAR